MQRLDEDVTNVREKLLLELVGTVVPAIARMRLAVSGAKPFEDERQCRTCVALARLAVSMVAGKMPLPEPPRRLAHPDLTEEEVLHLLDVCEGKCRSE